MRERSQRVLTGVIAAIYLIAAVWINGWWLRVNIIAVLALSVFELQRALRAAGSRAPLVYGWIYAAGLYPAWEFLGVPGVAALLIVCVLASMTGSLWSEISMGNIAGAVLWAVYPALPATTLFLVAGEVSSEAMMLTLLALCFVPAFLTDIFAYLFGGWLGRRKLSPKISPSKTIEGSMGGFLGALLGVGAVGCVARWQGVPIDWWEFAVLGILCGAADQAGDLWASLIKRASGIKDFGKLLPGHGGIIDRLDGVFFCSMAVLAWILVRGSLA